MKLEQLFEEVLKEDKLDDKGHYIYDHDDEFYEETSNFFISMARKYSSKVSKEDALKAINDAVDDIVGSDWNNW